MKNNPLRRLHCPLILLVVLGIALVAPLLPWSGSESPDSGFTPPPKEQPGSFEEDWSTRGPGVDQ